MVQSSTKNPERNLSEELNPGRNQKAVCAGYRIQDLKKYFEIKIRSSIKINIE